MTLRNRVQNLYQAATEKAFQFAQRHPKIANIAITTVLLYQSLFNPDYKIPIDIGFAEATIDPKGDYIRFVRRETGSDWTSVTERKPDGTWETSGYR